MVRSRYGRGVVEEYGRGTVEVPSRYSRGTVEVPSRYGRGMVAVRQVLSRYAPGSLVVRYTQGSFPPCILDAPRAYSTRTVRFIVRIVQSWLAGFGSAIHTIPLIRNV